MGITRAALPCELVYSKILFSPVVMNTDCQELVPLLPSKLPLILPVPLPNIYIICCKARGSCAVFVSSNIKGNAFKNAAIRSIAILVVNIELIYLLGCPHTLADAFWTVVLPLDDMPEISTRIGVKSCSLNNIEANDDTTGNNALGLSYKGTNIFSIHSSTVPLDLIVFKRCNSPSSGGIKKEASTRFSNLMKDLSDNIN